MTTATTLDIPVMSPKTGKLHSRKRTPVHIFGGWAIHRALEINRTGWSVTHVPTLRKTTSVPICCWASARALVAELGKFDMGFTLDSNRVHILESTIPAPYRAAWREAKHVCDNWQIPCSLCGGKKAE